MRAPVQKSGGTESNKKKRHLPHPYTTQPARIPISGAPTERKRRQNQSLFFEPSVSGVERGSALRNRVLFLEAGLQILKVYPNPALRPFLPGPQIFNRPRN